MPVWLYPSDIDRLEKIYASDNCKTKSEFIEKAIDFYIGYLNSDKDQDYWCDILSKVMQAMLTNTENHIARLQFKQAVELSQLCHVIAPLCQLSSDDLETLHTNCVNEVKSTNGMLDFSKALKRFRSGEIAWQD